MSSAIVKSSNMKRVQAFHVRKPPFSPHFFYWIILRNPLSRAVSAFNGAKKHMRDIAAEGKALAEFEAFSVYDSIHQIAEALYDDQGRPNIQAQRLLSQIGHMRYGIPFYLDELLNNIKPNQIEYVFCQEFLDADIRDCLNVEDIPSVHHNGRANWQEHLSNQGAANLRRFLHRDYELIDKLHAMGKIDDERLAVLKV